MEQGALLFRRTDPLSSREAARKAAPRAGTHNAKILAVMRRLDLSFLTAAEIADNTGIDAYIIRKRLPELERRGHIKATNRKNMEPGAVLHWAIQEK